MTAPIPTRKPLTAGSEIDAWCTRCKLDLGHRIVAMVGPEPKRVICQTCNSEHNYRAPKVGPKARTPGIRSAATSTAKKKPEKAKATPRGSARAHEEWQAQVRSGRPFREYSTDKRFDVGDLIHHSKFGEGYVVAVLDSQKLTIAFSTGERTLVHDRQA